MYDLSKHPYFEEYQDPKTGVVSYILKERVGEVQKNLYFTEFGGITKDEKYMWFRCCDWPKHGDTLAVVSLDPENPFIRRFNGAGGTDSGTIGNIVNVDGNYVFFSSGSALYKIDVDGNITKLFEIGQDFINYRRFEQLSTTCSVNSTGELVLFDMRIGDKSYVATGNLKTGEIKHIHKFYRYYNHAMFSPTDPDLFIIDQEWQRDPNSGERFDIDKRIWLMDTQGTRLEAIDPENWFRHNDSIYCHDFWSQDGWICWPDIIEYVYEYNVETKEKNMVWKRPLCHAHTLYRKYWVGDDNPYSWAYEPCKVWFFDRESGKEIEIFSSMPYPIRGGLTYHLDPHPSFSPKGTYVVSLTTVNNGVADVAITPTDALIKRCREVGEKVK